VIDWAEIKVDLYQHDPGKQRQKTIESVLICCSLLMEIAFTIKSALIRDIDVHIVTIKCMLTTVLCKPALAGV
jgi:hypothetical protein